MKFAAPASRRTPFAPGTPGLEADYRKTDFFAPLITSDGMILMSQLLFRF